MKVTLLMDSLLSSKLSRVKLHCFIHFFLQAILLDLLVCLLIPLKNLFVQPRSLPIYFMCSRQVQTPVICHPVF